MIISSNFLLVTRLLFINLGFVFALASAALKKSHLMSVARLLMLMSVAILLMRVASKRVVS